MYVALERPSGAIKDHALFYFCCLERITAAEKGMLWSAIREMPLHPIVCCIVQFPENLPRPQLLCENTNNSLLSAVW